MYIPAGTLMRLLHAHPAYAYTSIVSHLDIPLSPPDIFYVHVTRTCTTAPVCRVRMFDACKFTYA